MPKNLENFKLIFVQNNYAYFSNKKKEQINEMAEKLEWHHTYNDTSKAPEKDDEIICLGFENGDIEHTIYDNERLSSPFSTNQMLEKKHPYLIANYSTYFPFWEKVRDRTVILRKGIYAEASLDEFITFVKVAKGDIFVKKPIYNITDL